MATKPLPSPPEAPLGLGPSDALPLDPAPPSSSQVPDFIEFKLDPLQNAGPAPHRLREARRTFVLYLEPCSGTSLWDSLVRFQERSFLSWPNLAHNTTPHISVLGRVSIEHGSQSRWASVDNMCNVMDSEIEAMQHQLQPPLFAGFEIVQKPTRSLVMRVHTPVTYTLLARSIVRRMSHEQNISLQQVPPMDRLYLGYDVQKSIPATTAQRLLALAKETIQFDEWVLTGGLWRLALYEVILESRVLGVQQQVSLVKYWSIPKHTALPTPSTWLPNAVRVKLALLTVRFRRRSKTGPTHQEHHDGVSS